MNLDEGMTYRSASTATDRRGQSRTKKVIPWKPVAAVAAVLLTAALAASALLASSGEMNPTVPVPAPTSAAAPAEAGDHGPPSTTADTAAWSTLTYFLDGWGSKSATTRQRVFAATATKGLADGLAETSPSKIIVQPVEQIEVVGAGPYSVEFRLHFQDVETPTRVILVAHDEAESGWLVSSIEKIGA